MCIEDIDFALFMFQKFCYFLIIYFIDTNLI